MATTHTLNYLFDLPDSFRPKAEYALRSMLRPFGVRPVEVDQQKLLEEGGFFYGLTPPDMDESSSKAASDTEGNGGARRPAPIFAMISKPETWAFFADEEHSPLEPDIESMHSLEELPDSEEEARMVLHDARSMLKEWMARKGRSPSLFQIPEQFPLLFGKPTVEVETVAGDAGTESNPESENEPAVARHGQMKITEADLLASTFFLLSDWSETYIDDSRRDAHHRILYAQSLQGELNMGEFPLVDLYSDLLAAWLGWSGLQAERQPWNSGYKHGLAITMDIDNLKKHPLSLLWRESRNLFRNVPDPPEYVLGARSRPKRYAKAMGQCLAPRNPFKQSVNRALERLKERGYSCTLFLKSLVRRDANDARDYLSLRFVDRLVKHARQFGADIGYHSSYQAGFVPELFEREHKRLAERLNCEVHLHRAHYLRYDPESAPELLERQGIQVDSSLGWADYIGYRASTTHPHRMFDRKHNRPTDVWQIPMNMMDAQLMRYMNLTVEEALAHTELQLQMGSYFGGVTVWNFHHHIYDDLDAPYWKHLFEGALELIPGYKPFVGTLEELKGERGKLKAERKI